MPHNLFVRTTIALLAPRRLLPILLVSLPMVAAQVRFSRSGDAVWVALGMCALFTFLGPFFYRWILPRGKPHPWLPLRLLAYGLLGGIPSVFGWLMPELWEIGETFLTAGVNLLITATLFWVGGWGLARDMDMEEYLEAERRRADGLALEAERAQLMAMRAQLDPHFLFNTLNAIAEWCREDGEVAERAILELSALLRQVLVGVRDPAWPLEQELDLLRRLFKLHGFRDPERFVVDWQVADLPPDIEVPPMLLLPLAENAVKHGPAKGFQGLMTVAVSVRDDRLIVRIANPGVFGGERPGSEGLATVRRRLALAYGSSARFSIGPQPDHPDRTEALLNLPLHVGALG